ncbi:MAG: phosphoribosylamine--glycine ligase [Oligoflexales bacterium]
MQILLIGTGAREDALAWKIQNSPLFHQGSVGKLYTWPKEFSLVEDTQQLDLTADASWEQLADKVLELKIDLAICGPETPLAEGIKQVFEARGLRIFGPSKEAAMLESSKVFAKNLMKEAKIPTADFLVAHSREECLAYAKDFLKQDGKVVLKADGLASGKGVFVCQDLTDLEAGLCSLYSLPLNQSSAKVLVERCLVGRECSHFTIINKHTESFLGFAVDFKRAFDGDQGPNTGGMGCYTPVPWLPENAHSLVMQKVINPLKNTLNKRGLSYEGFLYVGLMWTELGPMVIEFNVRLGDPEAQVLAVHDSKDWLELILKERAESIELIDSNREKTVAIVMASDNYPFPKKPSLQNESVPLTVLRDIPGVRLFGASIAASTEGHVLPRAGRVFTVVAKEASFSKARQLTLDHCKNISRFWTACQWREDIAKLAASEES